MPVRPSRGLPAANLRLLCNVCSKPLAVHELFECYVPEPYPEPSLSERSGLLLVAVG
jgi:hypothetical protein